MGTKVDQSNSETKKAELKKKWQKPKLEDVSGKVTRKVQKFISPAILLVKATKKLRGLAVIQKNYPIPNSNLASITKIAAV